MSHLRPIYLRFVANDELRGLFLYNVLGRLMMEHHVIYNYPTNYCVSLMCLVMPSMKC
jgi:hypothetical protein